MLGLLLRRTNLAEPYVLAMALLVAAVVLVALYIRPGSALLKKSFAATSVACLGALVAVAMIRFDVFRDATKEDHVIEWLTACFLLAAAVVGLVAAVRLARLDRPSPLATLMAAGYFLAFWREIEWGRPFTGSAVWYSRSLFSPRAYVDPSYFDKFKEAVNQSSHQPSLYSMHIIVSAAVILFAAVVLLHLIRHRGTFAKELRTLPRTSHGSYFLMGICAYIGAQAGGRGLKVLLESEATAPLHRNVFIPHRILVEPLEMWGAMCFLASALALWHTCRRDAQDSPGRVGQRRPLKAQQ